MKKIFLSFVFFVQMINASLSNTIGWVNALEMFKSGDLNPNSLAGSIYIRDTKDINNVEIIDTGGPIFLVDLLHAISRWKPGALIRGFHGYHTKSSPSNKIKFFNPIVVSMHNEPIRVENVITEIVKRGGAGSPFSKKIIENFPEREDLHSPITDELREQYDNIQKNLVNDIQELSKNPQFFKQLALICYRNNIAFELTDIIATYYTNINAEYLGKYPFSKRGISQIFDDKFIRYCSFPHYCDCSDYFTPEKRYAIHLDFRHDFFDKEAINKTLNAPENTNLISQIRPLDPINTPSPIPFYRMPQFRQIATGVLFLTPVLAAGLSRS